MTNISTSKTREQDKYSSYLNKVLEDRLCESGSELSKVLVQEFKITDVNARKIISRAADNKVIRSSRPYTFGKGQFIYLFNEQSLDASMIKRICKNSRPPLYRLLQYMDANHGIISYFEALKITASPDKESSTKVQSLGDMVKLLKKLDIVYERKDAHGIIYIIYKMKGEEFLEEGTEHPHIDIMAMHYAKMVLDCSLIPDILRWLRKSNLIDNLNISYRNKKTPAIGPVHNNLNWDVVSYTKTTGINQVVGAKTDTKDKMTLVVVDVVLAGSYTQEHLDGFLSRIQINLNSVITGKRKIMPIVIYRDCDPLVLNRMGVLGFLAFDIGAVFGSKIYAVLQQVKELNELLVRGEDVDITIKNILRTLRTTGQEDALKDLKGVLFECLLYPFLKNIFPDAIIEKGRTLATPKEDGKNEYYEYDYIIHASHPDEIILVELKGYDATATISLGTFEKKASLKWFFNKTLPFAAKYFKKEVGEGKKIRGLFLTSAGFWEDGRAFVKKINAGSFKSLKLDVAYERISLVKLLMEWGFKNEVQIIEKFYNKEEVSSKAESTADW